MQRTSALDSNVAALVHSDENNSFLAIKSSYETLLNLIPEQERVNPIFKMLRSVDIYKNPADALKDDVMNKTIQSVQVAQVLGVCMFASFMHPEQKTNWRMLGKRCSQFLAVQRLDPNPSFLRSNNVTRQEFASALEDVYDSLFILFYNAEQKSRLSKQHPISRSNVMLDTNEEKELDLTYDGIQQAQRKFQEATERCQLKHTQDITNINERLTPIFDGKDTTVLAQRIQELRNETKILVATVTTRLHAFDQSLHHDTMMSADKKQEQLEVLIQDLYKLLGGQAPLSTRHALEDKGQEATPTGTAENKATVDDLTERLNTLESAFSTYKEKFDAYHKETNPILLALARVFSEDEKSQISVLEAELPKFIKDVWERLAGVEKTTKSHTSDIARLDESALAYMYRQAAFMQQLSIKVAHCKADVDDVRYLFKLEVQKFTQEESSQDVTLASRITKLEKFVGLVDGSEEERGALMELSTGQKVCAISSVAVAIAWFFYCFHTDSNRQQYLASDVISTATNYYRIAEQQTGT